MKTIKKTPIILIFALFLALAWDSQAQKMDNKLLGKIIEQVSDSITGQEGYWLFKYEESWLIVITDQKNNRMRIITPIARTSDLNEAYYTEALQANFHTVLDAKYAISDDIMWSVFIHPLRELSADQVQDAMKQVYYAAVTFGGSYSASDLVFPAKD